MAHLTLVGLRTPRALLLTLCLAAPLSAQAAVTQSAAQVRGAADAIMRAARYCTLVTIGDEGHPQARIVDPLIGADSSIWIATNPLSRKVGEIRRDPRVTLTFFNATANEYVTVLGRATIVTDAATKAAHWKTDWAPFYKEQTRGRDFLLIRVRPRRYEVSSPGRGINNDARTWRPAIVKAP